MPAPFVPKLPTPPAEPNPRTKVQLCELEPGCKNTARKLVGGLLHPGPDGTARAWVCEEHLSKLAVSPPFSRLSILAVLPE